MPGRGGVRVRAETNFSMTTIRVVLVTASGMKEARQLTRRLIHEKWAACVTIVPRVESTYWWKGNVETASEALLIIKTSSAKVSRLISRVRQLHSYTVPEVLALPVLQGNPPYVKWVQSSIR